MDVISTDEFEPRTVDKVERLLDLLDEVERHPALKGKLALHGGTAINLFMLDMPRLSVDIDVSYIGSVSREDMRVDRPRIEAGIEAIVQALGYAVEPHPGGACWAHFSSSISWRLGSRPCEGRLHLHEPLAHPASRRARDAREAGRQGPHVRGRRACRR